MYELTSIYQRQSSDVRAKTVSMLRSATLAGNRHSAHQIVTNEKEHRWHIAIRTRGIQNVTFCRVPNTKVELAVFGARPLLARLQFRRELRREFAARINRPCDRTGLRCGRKVTTSLAAALSQVNSIQIASIRVHLNARLLLLLSSHLLYSSREELQAYRFRRHIKSRALDGSFDSERNATTIAHNRHISSR